MLAAVIIGVLLQQQLNGAALLLWSVLSLVPAGTFSYCTLLALLGIRTHRSLHATQATLDVVHVTDDAQARPNDGSVLETVRANDLANGFAESRLHEVYHPAVVAGVLGEAARQKADLLVVVARRHSLLGSLFHRSVTALLIQESPIPVLILPAAG